MKRKIYHLKAASHTLTLGAETLVMGIINVTPDSFSRDGIWKSSSSAVRRAVLQAERMTAQGAGILDVGGESSRPGSRQISVEEELRRVIPVVRALTRKGWRVSVDTYKPAVAREALEAGACMINTIKGLHPDPNLLKAVKEHKAAVVLMHMRGTPRTMQKKVTHRDVTAEVIEDLRQALERCLDAGIDRTRIILDPGIGFGKTVEQNLTLLARLSEFRRFNRPILIGVSRKSFIGHVLNLPVEKRLIGSLAAASWAACAGAQIIRVHDVAETVQAVRLIDALAGSFDRPSK